jgi:hypothetical protein
MWEAARTVWVPSVVPKEKRNGTMAFYCIMRFGGRVKWAKYKLDENSGRNLSSFIIRYRLTDRLPDGDKSLYGATIESGVLEHGSSMLPLF